MRGDVDVLYDVAPDAFEFVKESPNAHIASFLRPYVIALAFNMAHPRAAASRDVRRALNLAVDRAAVIDTVAGGRGVPAIDHIWPNHWARDAAAPAFAFDPQAARRRRSTPPACAASRRRRCRPRFSFTCLVQADPRFERLALLIQRQLLGVDVDMRLEAVPMPVLPAAHRRRPLRRLPGRAGRQPRPRLHLLVVALDAGRRCIRTGYAGADAALDRVRAARTDDDLRAAVRELQRTMHDDPPAVFLYWAQTSRAVSRRFVLPAGDDVDILRSVDRWQVVGRAAGSGVAMKTIRARLAVLVATAAIAPLLAYGVVSLQLLRSATNVVGDRRGARPPPSTPPARSTRYIHHNLDLLTAVASDLQYTALTRGQQERILRNNVAVLPGLQRADAVRRRRHARWRRAGCTSRRWCSARPAGQPGGRASPPIQIDAALLPSTVISLHLDHAGPPVAYLVGRLSLEELWRVVDRVRVGGRGHAVLVDETGRLHRARRSRRCTPASRAATICSGIR